MSDEQIAQLKATYPSLQIQPKRWATPRQRVTIWVVGAVIAALLPLIAIVVSVQPKGFYEATSRGDLLVISGVLMIAGLAELVLLFWRIPVGKELQLALIPLGIVLYLLGDAYWYGTVSSHLTMAGEPLGNRTLAYGSIGMFVIAAVVPSYCVWLVGAGE